MKINDNNNSKNNKKNFCLNLMHKIQFTTLYLNNLLQFCNSIRGKAAA